MGLARSNQETDDGKNASTCLTKNAPYKGLGADSEEKREPVSDIDTGAVDSLKVLDPKRPIREADMVGGHGCNLAGEPALPVLQGVGASAMVT